MASLVFITTIALIQDVETEAAPGNWNYRYDVDLYYEHPGNGAFYWMNCNEGDNITVTVHNFTRSLSE